MRCYPIIVFIMQTFSCIFGESVSKDEFMSKIGIENYEYDQRHLGSFLKLQDQSTQKKKKRKRKHDEKLGLSFHCNLLFEDLVSKRGLPPVFPGPSAPPNYWRNSYTLGGQIKYETWYIEKMNEFANSGAVQNHTWSKDFLDKLGQEECKCGYYGGPNCKDAIAKYGNLIKGKHGLIIGTETPWAEAALIAAGAQITTIEYMKIYSDHPQLRSMTPVEAASSFLENQFQLADFAFSYSSLEHDGLGRYGDPLNPNGDLEAIARIHCMLKPNGTLFLGLPVAGDCVVWNAHRVYGNVRLSLILSYWDVVDVIGSDRAPSASGACDFLNQPVMVLRKLPEKHH